jgi:hypothetical protein
MFFTKVKNGFKTAFWLIVSIIHVLVMIALYLFFAGAVVVIPALFFIWVCRKLFGWF